MYGSDRTAAVPRTGGTESGSEARSHSVNPARVAHVSGGGVVAEKGAPPESRIT